MSVDTIFALSTGLLPSGVAIVRVSGPGVRFAFETMVGFIPEPRKLVLSDIIGSSGDLLDRGLVVFFPGPTSFTGEDCGEFHIHGGRAVLEGVLSFLGGIKGFRLAEAGEFSRRAFENGRLDLTEIEGLSDLIQANTVSQRRLALDHSSGKLRKLYNNWRDQLVKIRAYFEAGFDFSEEEDIPADIVDKLSLDISLLQSDILRHLETADVGEIIRDGFKVSLVGAPNSGKSSLLNALAKRDVAIVSEFAGTTRDIISVSLDLYGFEVIVSDTAGIRDTNDAVELMGIERTYFSMESADLVIFLQPVDDEVLNPITFIGNTNSNYLILHSKIDLQPDKFSFIDRPGISALTFVGLKDLENYISTSISKHVGISNGTMITRIRHRLLLEKVLVHLESALGLDFTSGELVSEELRCAGDQIGRIVGKIDVEDLLDLIFGEFCVGK